MEIIPIRLQDVDAVARIFDDEVGWMQDRQQKMLRAFDENRLNVIVAIEKSKVVGAVLLTDVFKEIPEYHVAKDEKEHVEALLPKNAGKMAILDIVAVAKDEQKKGYGSALVRCATGEVQKQGVDSIIAFGWVSPDGCHIEPTLIKSGYSKLGRVENYWLEDTKFYKHECPVCKWPCYCSMDLFICRFP